MKELKAHRLKREIAFLYVELHAHQRKCKHKLATKVHKSDEYNKDPLQVTSYWTEFDCPTCLSTWREEGSK